MRLYVLPAKTENVVQPENVADIQRDKEKKNIRLRAINFFQLNVEVCAFATIYLFYNLINFRLNRM